MNDKNNGHDRRTPLEDNDLPQIEEDDLPTEEVQAIEYGSDEATKLDLGVHLAVRTTEETYPVRTRIKNGIIQPDNGREEPTVINHQKPHGFPKGKNKDDVEETTGIKPLNPSQFATQSVGKNKRQITFWPGSQLPMAAPERIKTGYRISPPGPLVILGIVLFMIVILILLCNDQTDSPPQSELSNPTQSVDE